MRRRRRMVAVARSGRSDVRPRPLEIYLPLVQSMDVHALRSAAHSQVGRVISVFEVNEAFASVPLAWLAEVGADSKTVNRQWRRDRLGPPARCVRRPDHDDDDAPPA